ncbi:MAG: hypothetical protein ACRD27_06465 [Terracidiphilus sp.]
MPLRLPAALGGDSRLPISGFRLSPFGFRLQEKLKAALRATAIERSQSTGRRGYFFSFSIAALSTASLKREIFRASRNKTPESFRA